MKSAKIFMAFGSLALASAAFLAAKPIKKFSGIATGNFKGQASAVQNATLAGLSTSHFTTSSSGTGTVRLATTNGSFIATLKTGVSGTAKVYYH